MAIHPFYNKNAYDMEDMDSACLGLEFSRFFTLIQYFALLIF